MPRGPIVKSPPTTVEHEYVSYEKVFPPEEGPPQFHRLGSVNPRQEIALALPAEDFLYLWQLLEEECRRRWETRNSLPSAASYVRSTAVLREEWRRHVGTGTPRPTAGDESR